MAGTLHKREARHPWLVGATDVMWSRIGGLAEPTPYGITQHAALPTSSLPDQTGSLCAQLSGHWSWTAASSPLNPTLPARCTPHWTSPRFRTRSVTGRGFDEAIIEAHLDHLAHAQLSDGGWTFNWLAWHPPRPNANGAAP